MKKRRSLLLVAAVGILVSAANAAWALGFKLGETKEQLKLDYDVSATDHGTGRVTVNLALADAGRLKPLTSIDLVVPNETGTGYVDLALELATHEVAGKRTARLHLKRDLAERAEIQLKTHTLDGKQAPLTWYYHAIPLATYLKKEAPKKE